MLTFGGLDIFIEIKPAFIPIALQISSITFKVCFAL
jgi:hypothetical protein